MPIAAHRPAVRGVLSGPIKAKVARTPAMVVFWNTGREHVMTPTTVISMKCRVKRQRVWWDGVIATTHATVESFKFLSHRYHEGRFRHATHIILSCKELGLEYFN
jgi:hypothetical protein